jgi:predicted transporter
MISHSRARITATIGVLSFLPALFLYAYLVWQMNIEVLQRPTTGVIGICVLALVFLVLPFTLYCMTAKQHYES